MLDLKKIIFCVLFLECLSSAYANTNLIYDYDSNYDYSTLEVILTSSYQGVGNGYGVTSSNGDALIENVGFSNGYAEWEFEYQPSIGSNPIVFLDYAQVRIYYGSDSDAYVELFNYSNGNWVSITTLPESGSNNKYFYATDYITRQTNGYFRFKMRIVVNGSFFNHEILINKIEVFAPVDDDQIKGKLLSSYDNTDFGASKDSYKLYENATINIPIENTMTGPQHYMVAVEVHKGGSSGSIIYNTDRNGPDIWLQAGEKGILSVNTGSLSSTGTYTIIAGLRHYEWEPLLHVSGSSPSNPTFIVDGQAPTINITDTPSVNSNGYVTSDDFTFGWSASDDISSTSAITFDYKFDGSGSNTSSTSKSYYNISDGSHTFEVRAIDAAGNPSGYKTSTLMVDSHPPTLPSNARAWNNSSHGVEFSQNKWYATNQIWFEFIGNDGSGGSGISNYYEAFDTSSNATPSNYIGDEGTWMKSFTSPQIYEHKLYFRVMAEDKAGLTSGNKTLFCFWRDTKPPSVSMNSLPQTTATNSFPVSWTGSDGGAGIKSYVIQYKVGSSGTWTNWLTRTGSDSKTATFGPTSPVTVSDGKTYYFRCNAEDNSYNTAGDPYGNESGWSNEVYTTIDSGQSVQTGSLQVALTPSNGKWKVDGGSWKNSGDIVSNLVFGTHYVEYEQLSGYTAPASHTVSISSTQVMTLTKTYQAETTQTGSLQVALTPSNGKWKVDGGSWKNSGDIVSNLVFGTHYVEYEQLSGYYPLVSDTISINSTQTKILTRSYSSSETVSDIYLTGTWSQTTPLNRAGYGLEALEYQGKLYAFGGDKRERILEIFDDGKWSYGASMIEAQKFHSAALCNGKIYSFGSYGRLDITQIYDISSNTWSIGPSIPKGLYWATAEAVGDKIYLIGGGLGNVYILDTTSNTWQQGVSSPLYLSGCTSAVYDNTIYVFDSHGTLKYNVYNNTWTDIAVPSISRDGAKALALGDKILLIGGLLDDVFSQINNLNKVFF